MAAKKRGLGRGLDALLGSGTPAEESSYQESGEGTESGVRTLPVDLIQRGRYQPRRDFNAESLQELADSIAAQGVVQPATDATKSSPVNGVGAPRNRQAWARSRL